MPSQEKAITMPSLALKPRMVLYMQGMENCVWLDAKTFMPHPAFSIQSYCSQGTIHTRVLCTLHDFWEPCVPSIWVTETLTLFQSPLQQTTLPWDP